MFSSSRKDELISYLKTLGLESNDIVKVDIGLTHTSYVHDKNLPILESYERLEFLGDAVLKLIASEYLFDKYKDYDEGRLTKIRSIIISDACLADFAQNINLEQHILVGNIEFRADKSLPSSIAACAFEGLLGALYLTTDISTIKSFLLKQFETVVDDIDKNTIHYNAKAILQEYTQSQNKDLPEYIVKNEFGPEHDKVFEVEVLYKGKILASGEGKSKKEAQQSAAVSACKKLRILK